MGDVFKRLYSNILLPEGRSRLAVLAAFFFVASLSSAPAHAQLLGNEAEAQACAAAITVICGMPHEQVVALVTGLSSPDPPAKSQALELLRAQLPADTQFRFEAIAKFFEILGREGVEPEKLADTFARIAEEHLRLREQLSAFRSEFPEVQALREEAAAALDRADHDTASQALDAALEQHRVRGEALQAAFVEHKRAEARMISEKGDVERARLALLVAAKLYDEAAKLITPFDTEEAQEYILQAAISWYEHGRDKGNITALEISIARLQSLLAQLERTASPLEWARNQNNLGNALRALGTREGGTNRLQQAVNAFKAALEEMNRPGFSGGVLV